MKRKPVIQLFSISEQSKTKCIISFCEKKPQWMFEHRDEIVTVCHCHIIEGALKAIEMLPNHICPK